MVVEGKTPAHTLFWAESKQAWKPLAGLMLDVDPDRLDEFAKAGVKRVRVLGSGEKDCYFCALLAGQIFPIDSPPALPPDHCLCVPWCRLVLVAVAEETAPSTNLC